MNEDHLSLFIPVSEQLPKEGQEVLFLYKSKGMISQGYGYYNDEFNEWIENEAGQLRSPSHWLDLSKLTTIEKAKEAIDSTVHGVFVLASLTMSDIKDVEKIGEKYKNTL